MKGTREEKEKIRIYSILKVRGINIVVCDTASTGVWGVFLLAYLVRAVQCERTVGGVLCFFSNVISAVKTFFLNSTV